MEREVVCLSEDRRGGMVSKRVGNEAGETASGRPKSELPSSGIDAEGSEPLCNGKDSEMTLPVNNLVTNGAADVLTNGVMEITPIPNTLEIKIQVPGNDIISLQVSSEEMVQEIIQILMEREDTCHRTCFSLQHDGNILDNFAGLASIEGLKDGSVLRVVEEPYTVREVKFHIRHVRDLLKCLDPVDAYNGIELNSSSFLTTISEGDIADISTTGKRKRRSGSDQSLETIDCSPPEYILPGSKDRPLSFLQPLTADSKSLQCLKCLMVSGWNPPPGNRKLRGDLMYFNVITMEDRHVSITASTRGFYINQSTADMFNPKPGSPSLLCHSLLDLLNQISPIFKKNFAVLQKKRVSCHPLERVATPFLSYSWTIPHKQHTIDCVRAEDAYTSRLGFEEHITGQPRDWNEELQTAWEMPCQDMMQRILRKQTIFKVNSDFVAAATRGAMAVVDGNIVAINPGDDTKMQMFIWNNIFFSFGFDIRDNYKESGGDHAAYVASSNDLKGIQAYSNLDVAGLHVLGTVIVDYRGYRIIAQSIIPGILEQEQDQNVVYGLIDFGKTVISNHEYINLLLQTSRPLRIQKHLVLNDLEHPILLCSSVDCKGIVGNDGRRYILDLFRTFPSDLNFLPMIGEELHEECQRLGYPKEYRHKLCCLRPELVENFIQHKHTQFTKLLKEKMRRSDRRKSLMEDGESATENYDHFRGIDEMKAVCQEVGSVSDTIFDIRFNPNVYSSVVRFHESEQEALQLQKRLMKEIAAFLLTVQIPSFIKDCVNHVTVPVDGRTLTDGLHKCGINIRYIGKIAQLISHSEDKQYLDHISRLLISEIITRAAKHIIVLYLQVVEISACSSAISHFLNCFLSSYPNPVAHLLPDELVSRRKKNKRKVRIPGSDTAWANLTPVELWKQINNEANENFDYALACDGIDQAVERFGLQKISLLREFCIKAGIQILLREYNFDSRHKPTFTDDDILNSFPVIKHIVVKATDADQVYKNAQTSIQKGNIKEGLELLTESLNLFNNVYGALNPDICGCLSLLAQVNYIMDNIPEAISNQQKAVIVSERILGFDHSNTIHEYARLGLYCFANNQISVALRLLYRALYLMLIVTGEDHPEIAVLDSNIGLMLHAALDCDLAMRFLQKALELKLKYYGAQALETALSYHLVAQVYASKAEFRNAVQHEKEAYNIYRTQLGETHHKTKGSSEFLKHVTQQAVNLQRTMNEIYKNGSNAGLPPVQTTSLSNKMILQQLNMINGIVLTDTSRKSALQSATNRMRKLLQAEIQASQRLTKALTNIGIEDLIPVNGTTAPGEITNGAENLAEGRMINRKTEPDCIPSGSSA
ncbi:clustered mitochondria protein homolog isoform X1 [Chiloscyllium plagiosum]|uniref:clustered mitochondria protein homolog isoform X1 n=1 Tax=Chiloscyllium plagiosum TaxID=36176 RepID=UPI001CB86647|nr:clustered mitochondria protein homolog isoform X1 [Chiloscyllium plagiosum]